MPDIAEVGYSDSSRSIVQTFMHSKGVLAADTG